MNRVVNPFIVFILASCAAASCAGTERRSALPGELFQPANAAAASRRNVNADGAALVHQ